MYAEGPGLDYVLWIPDEVAAVVDEVRLKYPVGDTAILLTLEMVRALRGHGGEVREVIYPDAGHRDAVERAYAPGPELYDWFAAILAGGS